MNDLHSKVVVTGSTGFVGRAVVDQLRQASVPLSLPRRLNILSAEMPDISAVIHLAARVHVMHDTAAEPLAAFRAVNVVAALASIATLLGKRGAVDRLSSSLQLDISKARELLQWTPPVTLDEGLRRAFAGLKK